MRDRTQAPDTHIVLALRRLCSALAPALLGILAASCSLSALNIGGPGVDDTLVTHSIPAPAVEDNRSDLPPGSAAAGEAVAAALDQDALETPLPWEDVAGDIRGQVTGIAAFDGACRDFRTTRESFDGVSLYEGRLCRDERGGWQMTAFAPL